MTAAPENSFEAGSAEVISVGTELLVGQIIDSNACFLSQQLAELGISTYRHTVVGDNPDRLEKAIRMALEDNDLVVTTGGLGPTADDLTAEVAASVAGLPLLKDKAVTEELRRRYPDRTRYDFSVYPKVPSGAVVFKNETGTAPGSFVFLKAYDNRKAILMLPGPPDEMEPMFLVSVRPFLETFSRYRFRHRYVRLFGIGESKAEERIRDLVESQKEVTIAPYASIKEVVIRVSQRMDKAGGEDLTKAMTESLAGRFGPDVFEVGSRPLEAVLLDLLAERQMTMALAESCTAGMAASTLAGIPGSSAVLLGGVVTYNNEMKNRLLGVSSKILTSAGAVSCPVAIAMAEGCRARTGADVALSFTGIAGPGGGTEEMPAGTVWIACARAGASTVAKKYHFAGDRNRVRTRAVYTGLDLVRRLLLGL
ncbi:MAG TPA: competence/damage-inducible protein A [Bacillota bacterium]|jgi:nicotinamide-nucleotide amidase|nr:competence/damage-inducible protein A [Fastidiosipila sp.]HPX93518.1 competence/damage-inducible protein A [Bacillota bacterium]HQB81742.1 competence/damage-inducible protein A [Bacillota bacterium]